MKQMTGGDCGKSPGIPGEDWLWAPSLLSPRWELENFHKGRGGQGRPWCPWLISMAVWAHCSPRNSGRDRPGLLSAAYKPWTGLRQLCTPFGHQKRHHHGWRLNVPEKKTRRRGWSSQEPSEAPSSLGTSQTRFLPGSSVPTGALPVLCFWENKNPHITPGEKKKNKGGISCPFWFFDNKNYLQK